MLDRISFDQIQALVYARTDQGTKRALNAALNGINDTERTIRTKIATLRTALDETETQLDHNLHADGDLIQRAATDLDPGRRHPADPLDHRRRPAHRHRARQPRHHHHIDHRAGAAMMNTMPYQRGDRIALVRTADPYTRLQPGDTGTVTGCDPALVSCTSPGTAAVP
jgi:hypothetical protein